MLRRFSLTVVCTLLLVAGALASLTPLVPLRSRLDESVFAVAVCLWLAVVLLALLAAANLALRRIWFLRGQGEPVAQGELRQQLLRVNDLDCPASARAGRRKIVFTWRCGELRWCELFSRLGKRRLDEVHCRFDADLLTVYLADRVRAVDFFICPDQVKTGRRRIPLPLLWLPLKRLGSFEHYAALAEHDYTFHGRELKAAVVATILACGWHVRYTLF